MSPPKLGVALENPFSEVPREDLHAPAAGRREISSLVASGPWEDSLHASGAGGAERPVSREGGEWVVSLAERRGQLKTFLLCPRAVLDPSARARLENKNTFFGDSHHYKMTM